MTGSATWLRRQQTLAEFATLALAASDIAPLLESACRLIARGLDCPVVKTLKWMPETQDLLLCANVGIPPDIATSGVTHVPGGRNSAAGYTVLSRQPVISEIASETRFAPSEVVRRTKIRHSANVLVPCGNDIYGCMEADRLDDQPFAPDDIDFLQTFASLAGAAVLRLRDADRIAALLEEKDILLRELQHRVKNDLQVIVSILELQLRRAQSPETRDHLRSIGGRVESLRLVHEHLYRGQAIDRLDLGEYLRTLALDRFRMHDLDPGGAIRLETDLVELPVDRDLAMPLGLIANEFLTNSFKYAFPSGSGTIRLALARIGDREARMTLADDGPGSPAEAAGEKGTGLRLVELLARQIRARIEWSRSPGTRLDLTFDLPGPAAVAAEL